MTVTSTGGSTVAGTTAAAGQVSSGLGAADGTGPILSHVTPTAAGGAVAGVATGGSTVAGTTGTATTVATGTAPGAAVGTAAKTATMSKLVALGATGHAILGFALVAAATVCAGYLGFALLRKAFGEEDDKRPSPPTKSKEPKQPKKSKKSEEPEITAEPLPK